MDPTLLDLLRCPFCGGRLSVVENAALERDSEGRIESGVLGCECCAFPVVAGIPLLVADDATRDAMHTLEAGHREEALYALLGIEGPRVEAFEAMLAQGERATYRDAVGILSRDAEADYLLFRFSDPTYLVMEGLLRALGQAQWPVAGRLLDLCGGTGHLTRLLAGLQPTDGRSRPALGGPSSPPVVLADLYFWKLWVAARFMAPGCAPVCCDANAPLPFPRDAFSMVVLSDAFPYIWHKRMLAEEMVRVAASDSVVMLPHLHSSLGENFSAGNTLTPAAYRDLFAPQHPRLFSDEGLLTQVLDRQCVNLAADISPTALGTEPSFTLVASQRTDLFREYEVPDTLTLTGALTVNPLYRVESQGGPSILKLTFPTPEYEEEFGACKRYLPDAVTVHANLAGRIDPNSIGPQYAELRRRRILIDAPPRYC